MEYLSDFANGWTVIDLTLIVGFALTTLYYRNKLKIEKMRSYHNTTNISNQMRIVFENDAKKQEEVILRMFKSNNQYSASQVWKERFEAQNVPITSVRRAITNLSTEIVAKDGTVLREKYLDKTERMTDGIFGRPEHIYQFKR